MRNRGSFNRRTGKTTPRNKGKTHWGKRTGRSRPAKMTGKARAASPAKA